MSLLFFVNLLQKDDFMNHIGNNYNPYINPISSGNDKVTITGTVISVQGDLTKKDFDGEKSHLKGDPPPWSGKEVVLTLLVNGVETRYVGNIGGPINNLTSGM